MVSSNHLKPGQKGSISVKIDTAGRQGPLSKTVEVTTNDTKKHKVVLIIKALVK